MKAERQHDAGRPTTILKYNGPMARTLSVDPGYLASSVALLCIVMACSTDSSDSVNSNRDANDSGAAAGESDDEPSNSSSDDQGTDSATETQTPDDAAASDGESDDQSADDATTDDATTDDATADDAGTDDQSVDDSGGEEQPNDDAACGDASSSNLDDPACSITSNHRQGTRLRGRYVLSEEGDREWYGWVDSQLGHECTFQFGGDGSYYCQPNNYSSSTTVYLDDACSEAIHTRSMTGPCAESDYAMVLPQRECGQSLYYEFYELGEEVELPEIIFRLLSDGSCQPGTVNVGTWYRQAAKLPQDHFVQAQYGDLDVGGVGRVRSVGYTAIDGTRQLESWRDTALNDMNCRLWPTSDVLASYCVPASQFESNYAAGDACETPLYHQTRSCPTEPPEYAMDFANGYCLEVTGFVEVGAEYTDPVNAIDGCEASELGETTKVYEATPLGIDTFARTMLEVDDTDPGRLKPAYDVMDDGGRWFASFWDTEHDVACRFYPTEAGDYRCIPRARFDEVLHVFSDANCSESVAFARDIGCGTLPALGRYSVYDRDECLDFQVPYRSGAAISAAELPEIYALVDGVCEPFIAADGNYAPLTEVSLDEFMRGEMTVD